MTAQSRIIDAVIPEFATIRAPARILQWESAPVLDVVRRWPATRPLVALVSCASDPMWSRWSVLATPASSRLFSAAELDDLLTCLREAGRARKAPTSSLPFVGGWILSLRYELGALLEPAVGAQPDGAIGALHYCPDAVVHDGLTGAWWSVGEEIPALMADPDSNQVIVESAAIGAREGYEQAVERALEYIAAGDVYQVNLAHRATARFRGDPRVIFAHLARRLAPWYGAYIDEPGGRSATLSFSPELLCQYCSASRRAVVRPIKGTRAGDADPQSLLSSNKDRAELAMIVDLTRNDLGRVCAPGSIRVRESMRPERHGAASPVAGSGVLHGVATVEGVLRRDCGVQDLLQSLFPAGSITGAPKIRAMQIIDELERLERGPYCGSIGYVSFCGNACFNVGIRTASIAGPPGSGARLAGAFSGEITFPVGAGIVADSKPMEEWNETMNKAAGFLCAIEELRTDPQKVTP